MKTKILGGLIMIAVFAITSAANAQTVAAHQMHRAHHKFEHRLKKDVRNGELTRMEARHFKMEAKRIHQEKRMAIAHGAFTPAEKMRIHNERKMMVRNLKREERRNENRIRG